MKINKINRVIPPILVCLCTSEIAFAKKFDIGDAKIDARVNLDLQAAAFKSTDTDWETSQNLDWALRLKVEHPVTQKIKAGFLIKIDQDFDVDGITAVKQNIINTRIATGYLKTQWGDFSLGKLSGQADKLSVHAPQIGTGQIRGDFTRYKGKPAMMNAFDTQNALKLDYVSPKDKPIIFGMSYAPKMKHSSTFEIIQRHAFEFGLQSNIKLKNKWTWVSSAAYVTSTSVREARQKIDSTGFGTSLRQGRKWEISAAYVDRGDSNTRAGLNQTEINGGIRYRNRKKKWGLSTSFAAQSSSIERRTNFGLGGEKRLHRYARIRFDAVAYKATPVLALSETSQSENGFVLLSDIRVNY